LQCYRFKSQRKTGGSNGTADSRTARQLYSQEKAPDPIVHAKFFTPDSNWTWYVTEGEIEEDDFRFFGYVRGLEEEWGYSVLSELESVRGPLGLAIERDLHFTPGPSRT
jgi:Protein of unknown function (DUF2958)